MTRQPLYTRGESKVSLVCPFVCLFILHHLVLFPFAFSEENLFLGLKKRRKSRTSSSSFNESFDSSHDDWDEHNNYHSTSFNDSDFDIEDSEAENTSTSKSNLSSPSTEESPDSPYNMESMLQVTLPLLGEGQFPRRDEQGSNKKTSAQSPTEDNSDTVLLRGSTKNFSPFATPPSSSPKEDEPPELLSRRDSTRRSKSKKGTLKKLPAQFLRGVSPFRQTFSGRRNSHGNHQNDCDGPGSEAGVGEGPSHEGDPREKETKMKEWDKYRAGGIFEMTADDLRSLMTSPRKENNLETMLERKLSLDDENAGAYGGGEAEEENDDSIKGIYLSCLKDLTYDEQTDVVGKREKEGKNDEEGSDYVNIYGGDRANEKESELKRLNKLFRMYEKKKEEIKRKRLHRRSSAHTFNNDHESHPDIPNEDNYKNMKDLKMEVNSLLDNASLASLPIEFINE